jgi:hypothetical protein
MIGQVGVYCLPLIKFKASVERPCVSVGGSAPPNARFDLHQYSGK